MDASYLRDLGMIVVRSRQMAADRGFPTECIQREMSEADIQYESERLYTRSKTEGISLAEAASASFSKGSTQLHVIVLDRNFDLSKRRSKMISTDQVKAARDVSLTLRRPGDSIIWMSPNKWSPQAKKEDLSALEPLSLFAVEDLWIRIPEHESFVPHVPVHLETIRKSVSPFVEAEHLPRISKTDAVVRWFGFPVGTLLHIQRPGHTCYRRVTE